MQEHLRRIAAELVPIGGPPGLTMHELMEYEAGRAEYPAPWAAHVTWQVTEGRAVPAAVTLYAMRGQPVTAEAWRGVRVADVIEQSRASSEALQQLLHTMGELAATVDAAPPDERQQERARRAEALHAARPRKRGGQPHYGEDHYRRVAQVYSAAIAASDPRPVLAVVRALGLDPKTDHTRAKGWVAQARKRGLIPPATREDD